MADADTVTVDGVEPTILVRYVDNKDKNDSLGEVILRPYDDGGTRRLVLGGSAVKVTSGDLGGLGRIELEIIEESPVASQPVARTVEPVPPPPVQNYPQPISPGQSG